MKLLHKIIFWTHLLAGVIAGLVIFIMSFTGVVLMYEPQISEYSEWNARWVTPGPEAKRLSLDELVAKVRASNPDAHPAVITVKSDPTASVIVNLGRENTVFINPYTGELLGGLSATHNLLHEIVDWHRWLGTEGESRAIGKAITGACNLVFFWLAVTGVYLWWPHSWKWRGLKTSLIFNGRLSGKARDWNWHNVIGFWSSSVLVVLTLTAAVMSYPWANDLLYTLTGSEPPPRAQGPAGPSQRARRGSGNPQEQRIAKPMANLDALLATAERQVPGWTILMMRFPPRPDGPVTVSISEPSAPHTFARSQLTLNRATAEVMKREPYSENSAGRKLRTWFRGLHTGEAFGLFGQTIAGLASLGGCFLVWTGLAMAWRRFRSWGREVEEPSVTQPALSKDAASIEISRDLQLEGEKSSMELDILPGESSQLGHSTDGNGTGAHRHEAMGNSPGHNSVLILFGTVTGNAESLARRTAEVIARRGFDVRVKDMAHYAADALSQEGCVVIITSTYGNGEPPEDAALFWERVVQKDGLNLRGVKFSVLALGNSTYDHFCKCGRDLDAALERHGATRFYPRVDCDVDYDVPAKCWTEGVLASLQRDHSASAAA
ncbi:MAG TPA: PepSY domain-containing protein [Candidatus Binatia bacterium]